MSEERNLSAMSDNELEDIVGGEGKFEYGDNGDFSFYYECPYDHYREFITSGNSSIYMTVDGDFKCPKCGYTNDFHLVVDRWGVKAYGRP